MLLSREDHGLHFLSPCREKHLLSHPVKNSLGTCRKTIAGVKKMSYLCNRIQKAPEPSKGERWG